MKDIKNTIIIILIIAIIIFTMLLIKTYSTEKAEIDLETCEVDSVISKDTIYQEVLEEVTVGTENYVTHTDEGKRTNTSDKIKETRQIEGAEYLEVTGLKIEAENRVSTITATVKNNSNQEQGDFLVTISILGEDGREIIALGAYVNAVSAGEETQVCTTTTIDVANAYDYVVKK